jgi:hypothetical protein
MSPWIPITECRNRRLEPMGRVTPGKTHGLTRTGPGLACQDTAGRDCGCVLNWTDPFYRSKHGPLASCLDPLLPLRWPDYSQWWIRYPPNCSWIVLVTDHYSCLHSWGEFVKALVLRDKLTGIAAESPKVVQMCIVRDFIVLNVVRGLAKCMQHLIWSWIWSSIAIMVVYFL